MIIKNFSGGQSSDDQVGIKGAFKIGRNLDIRKKTDSLSCNNKLVEISALASKRVNVYVTCPNGSIYAFCQNGQIYVGSLNGSSFSLSYTDTDGSILGAGLFNNGTTVEIYYIVGDTTSKKLKRSPITVTLTPSLITSWTQDLPTAWNPLLQVMDRLMFSTGNKLGMVEMDGSYQLAVEIFPYNYVIKSMGATKDYLVLGFDAVNQTETFLKVISCGAEIEVIKTIPVLASAIDAIIKSPEDLLIFAGGVLFTCDLTDVYPLKDFEGASCNPNAICSRNRVAHFGASKYGATLENEGIFSYGRNNMEKPKNLNNDFYYDAQETMSMCSTIFGNLIVCYNDGGSYKSFYEDITQKAIATYETLDIYPSDSLTPNSTIKTAKLVMKKLPANCKVRVGIIPDKSATITGVSWLKDGNGDSYTTTTNAVNAFFPINASYDILNVIVELTPSGSTTPEIHALILS